MVAAPNQFSSRRTLPRVLIVDDDASIRLTCAAALRTDGWETVGEGSPRAALERLTRGGERYDVLVLDYTMPELDGLAVASALEPKLRPPILLASAQADGAVAISALRLGIWGFQAKPFLPDELRRRVRRLHQRRVETDPGLTWRHRALLHCERCEWADALRELEAGLNAERTETGHFLLGLVRQIVGDESGASTAFKQVNWRPDWHRHGGEILSELARRLD